MENFLGETNFQISMNYVRLIFVENFKPNKNLLWTIVIPLRSIMQVFCESWM